MRFGLNQSGGTARADPTSQGQKSPSIIPARLQVPDPDFEVAELSSTILSSHHASTFEQLKQKARQQARSASIEPQAAISRKQISLPWMTHARVQHDQQVDDEASEDSEDFAESSSSASAAEDEDGFSQRQRPSTLALRPVPITHARRIDSNRKRISLALHGATRALDDEGWKQPYWQTASTLSMTSRSKSRSVSKPIDRYAIAAQDFDADLDSIQNVLSAMRVSRQEEEEGMQREFKDRVKNLWDEIESSIKRAEEESRQAAAAEAERLRAMRLKQLEQERIAEEARKKKKEREEAERKARETTEVQRREKEKADKEKHESDQRQAQVVKDLQERKGSVYKDAKAEYERWRASMKNIKENVIPAIRSNPTWKKQCFEAKRKITPKIGQLTNSRQEIARITMAIDEVLSAARATNIAEIYFWILNHLSKCLIRQAEQEVAAKQSAAFPLAQTVSWLLLMGHEELGNVLMSRLVKKCCWCLGYLPPREKDQDEASFAKQFGRKSPDETSSNFTSRLCGIFAFYIAIVQVRPTSPPSLPGSTPEVQRIPHHFRSESLWKWQARSLLPPFIDQTLTPSLWSTFLEVGGAAAQRCYGRQAGKIFNLVLNEAIRGKRAKWASAVDSQSASIRLSLLIEQWQKEGRFKVPEGAEMGP